MYLLNNAVLPMMDKKKLRFEGLTGEESPQTMGGLLLTLVVLLHIAVFYFITSLAADEPVKPAVIMEVSMVAVPLPVADVAPPLPTVEPPPPIVPPPPKPQIKPKPVVKPKPKLKPKPVVPKTEPIYIPVAEKPSPVPVTPAPAPPRPAAAPAKAAPGPSKPKEEKFTPASGANYGYNPKPKYPAVARSRGWEGKVILNVRVSASGESEGVSVIQSSGHDILDEAAVSAVEGWRFVPAKRGDQAVASTVHVPINFKLDN
jgi:periplasmic protein TonB